MHRYCYILPIGKVDRGDFHELHIKTVTGESFHVTDGFVDALALRIMQRYESQPIDATLEIDAEYLDNPERTKYFYRRLFQDDGLYTLEFVTTASETIGIWVEERLEQTLIAHGGIPHNSTPAYDVLSVYEEEGKQRLRVVQVKATKDELQSNCSEALTKFELLERGYYDAELSACIDLIVGQRRAPKGLIARELKLNRRYRVTAVHSQEREGISIMTTFSEKIQGNTIRRSCVLIKIDWHDFWEHVARRIYAQLA
jgi:hypothetical protein